MNDIKTNKFINIGVKKMIDYTKTKPKGDFVLIKVEEKKTAIVQVRTNVGLSTAEVLEVSMDTDKFPTLLKKGDTVVFPSSQGTELERGIKLIKQGLIMAVINE